MVAAVVAVVAPPRPAETVLPAETPALAPMPPRVQHPTSVPPEEQGVLVDKEEPMERRAAVVRVEM